MPAYRLKGYQGQIIGNSVCQGAGKVNLQGMIRKETRSQLPLPRGQPPSSTSPASGLLVLHKEGVILEGGPWSDWREGCSGFF